MQQDAENGGICTHAARGAETSSGGWRVSSVVDVQMDGDPL